MFGLPKRSTPSVPFHDHPVACTWLLAALALVILPHVARMPLWITLTVCCLGIYRLLHDHLHWRLPPRWLVILFALFTVFGITASFGAPTGRRAAIAFLVALLGLKLLETRTQRDVMVLSCLGYFLVITHFLYSQSLGMVAYLMGIVWLLTVTMMHFQHLGDVDRTRLRVNLRQGSLLFVQSLPLMVILFVFFPRVDGPLWSLPEDSNSGITGFSDHMSPGQITKLSTSTAVAFRVEFADAIPPPNLRYWRGLVLWDYDGYTWRQGPAVSAQPIHWRYADTIYTYTITLEPHDQRWLFSLDLPFAFMRHHTTIPFAHAGHYHALGALTSDFQLRAKRPISHLTRYTLRSYARYHTGDLSGAMRIRARQLPNNLDTRVRNLAGQWRQENRQDRDVVRQALRYFRDQPFVYTLTPPVVEVDPTAEFLFETRRGYCEHFASSFTVLMRAAGIPARVVIGYQGGEVNPLGHHLTVRQSHAHAWSEVWLADQGWVRVDPTAAVAPERIEVGIEALPEFSLTPLIIRYSTWANKLWRTMRLSWDALHYQWNHWVVQYSAERQTQLMAHIGLGELTWRGLTMVLVVLLSIMLAIFALRMLRPRTPRDRVVKAYQAFCNKLARRGVARKSSEGPLDFAQRVNQQRPELAAQVDSISGLYSALRYGRRQSDADIQRLQHTVRAFRP
jgi:transglutaminase-like putative cysteine protease